MKRLSLLGLLLLLFNVSILSAQSMRIEFGTKLKSLDRISELTKTPIKELPVHFTLGYVYDLSKLLYLEVEATFTKENVLLNDKQTRPVVEKIDLLATIIPALRGDALFPRYYSSSIKLPLNVGVKLNLIGPLGVNFELGPYVIFNLNSEIGYEGSDKFDISKIKTNIESAKFLAKQEYGLNASLALAYSKLRLRLGAEYNLTDKVDTDKGFSENFEAIKPLFENINKDKLSYYLTLGINI